MKRNSHHKHKLILRSTHNMQEKVLCTYSPKLLLAYFIIFCILLIGGSFVLFNTVFSKWVNPYHYYGLDAKKIEQMHQKIVDVEDQLRQNDLYINGIHEMLGLGANVTKAEIDNVEVFEEDLNLNEKNQQQKFSSTQERELKLQSPVIGKILQKYNNVKSDYKDSIIIQAHNQAPITSIASGTVITLNFCEETNLYTVAIQHDNGVVSILRFAFVPLIKCNQKLKPNDIIAIVPKSQKGQLEIIFSIYINGDSVDPEKYIKF